MKKILMILTCGEIAGAVDLIYHFITAKITFTGVRTVTIITIK